jgi:hypothetical protein
MNLEISDDETAALIKELDDITRNDRYPFSERIRTLKVSLRCASLCRRRRYMRHRERPPLPLKPGTGRETEL